MSTAVDEQRRPVLRADARAAAEQHEVDERRARPRATDRDQQRAAAARRARAARARPRISRASRSRRRAGARPRRATAAPTSPSAVAQRARGGLRVVGLGDRAHDGDAAWRRRPTTRATVSASMPPIANHGQRRVRRPRGARAPGRSAGGRAWSASRGRARRRCSRRRARGVDLLGRVRREPDERVGPDELARRLRDRRVVLADVHAVGAGGRDEVGAVVEDEQRAGGVAALRGRHGGRGEQLVVGGVLVAQLDDVDAAAQRGARARRRSGRPPGARRQRGTGARAPGGRGGPAASRAIREPRRG